MDIGEVSVGLRFARSVTGGVSYAAFRLEGAKKRFQKYVYAVWGSSFYEIDPEAKTAKEVKPKQKGELAEAGAVGFIIDGGGSVQIKNVRYVPITDAK